MKIAKKFLSIILSVITLLSIIPVTVNAAEVIGKCGENVTWAYDDSTSTLTISGEGAMNNYNTGSKPWEKYKTNIKKVVVENGVTTIGGCSFYYYDNLSEVIIPESVVSIRGQVFLGCTALVRLTIPNSVKEFGYYFSNNSLIIDYCGTSDEWKTIIYNNSGNESNLQRYFVNCQDGKVYPSGSCGENLTWVIDDSKTLTITGEGEMYDFDHDYFYDEAYTPWGDNAEKVVITEGVTSIGAYAFYYCEKLVSVEIAGSVKKIGNSAFENCHQLSDVTISNGVEIIDDGAFTDCDSLLAVEIPGSVKSVGKATFYYCSNLTNVAVGDGVETIGAMAFYECTKLTAVTIGKSVKEIGALAFYKCCELERIIVDEANEHYSNDKYGVLFDKQKTTLVAYPLGSPMTEYAIPDGVTTISGNLFPKCTHYGHHRLNLAKISFPGSVTTIPGGLFENCKYLTSVIIGDGVKTIGEDAFYNCSNLEKIVIGKSVETIGKGAFDYCNKLSDVYYTGSYGKWIRISGRKDSYALWKAAKIHFNCQRVVTPPTCTEEGYVTYTCSCCDVGCVFDSIEPTGHIYSETQILPTCTTHGYTKYECEYCDNYYFDYTANPTGHTFSEDGICEICGEKETTTTPVNTQMLTIESVLAMVMNLLAKIFGVFSVA